MLSVVSRIENSVYFRHAPRGTCDNYLKNIDFFLKTLKKWNKTHNLFSIKESDDDLWQRHIADSCNFIDVIDDIYQHHFKKRDTIAICDIGSGGGFPGLLLAMCFDRFHFTLVESRRKKASFLQHIIYQLDLSATVLCQRIEDVNNHYDIVTARALGSCDILCHHTQNLLHEQGIALFAKGNLYQQEIDIAKQHHQFSLKIIHGTINPDGRILQLQF